MSRKDVEKTTPKSSENDNKQTEVRTGSAPSSLSEQQRSFNRVLDETNENIKRSIEEAINDYQEQTLQAAKEITESFLDTQKEIVNSFQSAWAPHIENYYDIWNNWASPRRAAEIYARSVSNFVDNTLAATKIGRNAILANMDAFTSFIQREKEDAKEFSRIGANTARIYAQTSRDVASDTSRDSNINSRLMRT